MVFLFFLDEKKKQKKSRAFEKIAKNLLSGLKRKNLAPTIPTIQVRDGLKQISFLRPDSKFS
jgi:hypothetical protein